MPKVIIQKTRKERNCQKCNEIIKVGKHYKKWSFFRQKPKVRCMKDSCSPTARDLTQDEYEIDVYDLQDIKISITCEEDIETTVDMLVESIEQTADVLEEKLDNIPENFRYGERGELLDERYNILTNCIQELGNINIDFDEDLVEELTRIEDEIRGLIDEL